MAEELSRSSDPLIAVWRQTRAAIGEFSQMRINAADEAAVIRHSWVLRFVRVYLAPVASQINALRALPLATIDQIIAETQGLGKSRAELGGEADALFDAAAAWLADAMPIYVAAEAIELTAANLPRDAALSPADATAIILSAEADAMLAALEAFATPGAP